MVFLINYHLLHYFLCAEYHFNFKLLFLMKAKTAKLVNGKTVAEGDHVFYINSDGLRCEGYIEVRKFNSTHEETGKRLKKGTLFFWNIGYEITDYPTLDTI